MKTLAVRIQDVRAYVAEKLLNVPGSSSYIMQLDSITHDVQELEEHLRRAQGQFGAADAELNVLKVKCGGLLMALEDARR